MLLTVAPACPAKVPAVGAPAESLKGRYGQGTILNTNLKTKVQS